MNRTDEGADRPPIVPICTDSESSSWTNKHQSSSLFLCLEQRTQTFRKVLDIVLGNFRAHPLQEGILGRVVLHLADLNVVSQDKRPDQAEDQFRLTIHDILGACVQALKIYIWRRGKKTKGERKEREREKHTDIDQFDALILEEFERHTDVFELLLDDARVAVVPAAELSLMISSAITDGLESNTFPNFGPILPR